MELQRVQSGHENGPQLWAVQCLQASVRGELRRAHLVDLQLQRGGACHIVNGGRHNWGDVAQLAGPQHKVSGVEQQAYSCRELVGQMRVSGSTR